MIINQGLNEQFLILLSYLKHLQEHKQTADFNRLKTDFPDCQFL